MNKIKLSTFLNACGIIEIKLRSDLLVIGEKRIWLACNSVESAKEMWRTLADIEENVFKKLGVKIDRCVEHIIFRWHGWRYELDDAQAYPLFLAGKTELLDLYYLIAKERVYGNW